MRPLMSPLKWNWGPKLSTNFASSFLTWYGPFSADIFMLLSTAYLILCSTGRHIGMVWYTCMKTSWKPSWRARRFLIRGRRKFGGCPKAIRACCDRFSYISKFCFLKKKKKKIRYKTWPAGCMALNVLITKNSECIFWLWLSSKTILCSFSLLFFFISSGHSGEKLWTSTTWTLFWICC